MAKSPGRKRADLLMVERGLAESRERAQTLIAEGLVFSKAGRVLKSSTLLARDAEIDVRGTLPYVSRGGLKLSHALDVFGVSVDGLTALDVGASTGGFTDCMLQRGASRVYAVDVGYGQMSYKLRQDPRVVVMERVNARYPFELPETSESWIPDDGCGPPHRREPASEVDLMTVDVSFISSRMVIPSAMEHLKTGCSIIALVKPQFEAEKGEVGRGGVIRDPALHAAILGRVIVWAVDQGLRVRNLCPSPVPGRAGNREFLMLLQKPE